MAKKSAAKQDNPKKGIAITSLVLGIVGIIGMQFILGPLAVIFGFIALHKIKHSPKEYGGRGMALAGIIIGFFDILMIIILLFFFASLFFGILAAASNA